MKIFEEIMSDVPVLSDAQEKQIISDGFIEIFGDWTSRPNRLENCSKMVDEFGRPQLYYHSYDYENYDSGLIYFSTDREYSEEFGENTEAFFLNCRKPYVATDGILRYEDGTEVMFEGEPATIGYLDSVDEEYVMWL